MCGSKELDDFSDNSSESDGDYSDTESMQSFHSVRSEKVARRWAYCIMFCYCVAATSLIAIFVTWFFHKSEKSSDSKDK